MPGSGAQENRKFTVAPDVVATEFDGKDAVILNLATKKYYTLNETATAIWSGIEEGKAIDGLVDLLMSRYDVTREKAHASVLGTIATLEQQSLVQSSPAGA